MLLPAPMVEVEAVVHDSVKYEVLKTMQRRGFLHITSHGIEHLENARSSEKASLIVDYEFRIGKLLEILNIAKKKRKGLLASLSTPPPERYPAKYRRREEILNDARETLSSLENKILDMYSKWEHVNAQMEKIKTQITYVEKLKNLPFDLGYLGEGMYVYVVSGIAKNIKPLHKLKSKGVAAVWYIALGKKKATEYLVVLASHIKDKREVESALRFAGFSEFELGGWSGYPDDVLKRMNKKLKELEEEKKEVYGAISNMRNRYYGKLGILKDELYNEKIKEEIHPRFGKTAYTTVIHGFIPKKKFLEEKKILEEAARGLIYIKWQDAKGDNVPVQYSNPRIFRPFQAFVEMYSTPKYGHIDPTVIIAPLFVVYFGLTLGDAGYGMLMAILGYVLWRVLGKYNWTNRILGSVLFVSGLSAVVFGLIQGGIFGPLNSSNPVSSIIQYKPIMDPMQDPITLLVISLLVGISQISLGLVLGAYHHIKDKKYEEFLQAEVSWFILLPAGGALIGHYFGWWTLSPIPLLLSTVFTVIGIIIFLPGVAGKFVNRKASINGLFFFDITGMVGDWLSFSRLLALDLATSGIALTINILASIITKMAVGGSSMVCCLPLLVVGVALYLLTMRGKDMLKKSIGLLLLVFGVVGMVSFSAALYLFVILFLIIGHISNSLLQSLGSFVHSLRLQYVEFFSKFYEGDGVKYSPFREVRHYSHVEVKK